MGNAAYKIDGVEENGVVGQERSFLVTLKDMNKPSDQIVNVDAKVTAPDGTKLSVTKTEPKAKTSEFKYTPTEKGGYKIDFEFTYQDPTKKPQTTSKTCLIFESEDAKRAHEEKLREQERRKKDAERIQKEREATLMLEAKQGKGIFSLEPRYTSTSDIPPGTRFLIKKKCEQKDGKTFEAVISNQEYLVTLSDLKADEKAVQEIKNKLKEFPSFPEVEANRPRKQWPLAMPLEQVLVGAAHFNCVHSIKEALARGVDPNLDLGFDETPLSKVCSCGPAKKPEEWKTEHGVSRNWSWDGATPKWSTYRQAKEVCSVASAIVLLKAGAEITDKVRKNVAKESFFAKGVQRIRMLRVLEAYEKGFEIDWSKSLEYLENIDAPWPPTNTGSDDGKAVVSTSAPMDIFSLEPRYKDAKDIKDNTTVAIRGILENDVLEVTIDNQPYTVKMTGMKANEAAVSAIKKKLETFASFPEEEARRPKKAWPIDMPLTEVLKGAADMNCPHSLKQVLARGLDPNLDLGWKDTPLSKVAKCGPAKKPEEWKTEFGVSRNWQTSAVTPKFHTYRQARESDSVACAIILLQAGAKITERVKQHVNKDSFFAKGVPRTRMLRVFKGFQEGIEVDWTAYFKMLDDANAPFALEAKKPSPAPTKAPTAESSASNQKVEEKKNADPEMGSKLIEILRKSRDNIAPTREQLEELWDHYDSDKNGELDSKECSLMLNDMFKNMRSMLTSGIQTDPSGNNPLALLMIKECDAVIEQVAKEFSEEKEVKRRMAIMDENSDGKIEKKEFLNQAGKGIFDQEKFVKKVEVEMEKVTKKLLGNLLGGFACAK